MPMTEREVQSILNDPTTLPDSDDEEDLDEWKVASALRSSSQESMVASVTGFKCWRKQLVCKGGS